MDGWMDGERREMEVLGGTDGWVVALDDDKSESATGGRRGPGMCVGWDLRRDIRRDEMR